MRITTRGKKKKKLAKESKAHLTLVSDPGPFCLVIILPSYLLSFHIDVFPSGYHYVLLSFQAMMRITTTRGKKKKKKPKKAKLI